MSEIDTLRWGDTETMNFTEGGAATFTPPTPKSTKQLVHAHWNRPLTWRLMLIFEATVPAAETATFAAVALVTVGVGGGQKETVLANAVFSLANGYATSVQFFDIPAQDMQVRFILADISGAASVQPHSFAFSAFAAPLTEPAGYTEILKIAKRAVRIEPEQRPPESGDSTGLPHWMPSGFDDGELRYR